ncbi:protein of unknown function [Taphrina deformans PYCC 5710]|uniref:GH16 domain-containing protein n=1 Tax=Taphrina deformans (strain PYCC 5710 / ATCC 11124 / CBS 356.35 / IMI 108563 / JCM 9778 / NBRC 8474) TaxID=1097556 RepID=R4XKU0_TAPDE|nr:protein of unknown function [Taphrina deformans PYCC 5710]|eukprot:CCG85039.1 protein of unknown function [Taphrina deformans PYCC 5710]
MSTNASTQDLFWTGRADGPYAYEHEATSSTDLNTQTVTEKFDIGPTTNLLWDPSYVEDDDDLHNPDVDNPKRDTNIWTKRGLTNLGGLVLVVIALVCIFVVIPALTFEGNRHPTCTGDSCLDNGRRALLKKPRTSLIDPDTPSSALTKTSAAGKTLKLVFSDEFNQDGRTFYPGDDQFFEAKDLWYWPTQDLEWYDPDAVTTRGGYLELRMDAFRNHDLNYRSGMIQSWNMLCFKGGMLEVSVEMPGAGSSSGLWPAVWTMGNLGRAGYGATTDGMWPYSYQACDVGITPNQSRSDGLSWLPGMRLPSCLCNPEEAPGSVSHARSAPEIDVFEASVGEFTDGTTNGIVSQSYQIGPFDDYYQPNYEFSEIYNDTLTTLNSYTGGPYQQALSGVTALNNQWYQYPAATADKFQTYAFEYVPGGTTSSSVRWYVGGEAVWKMNAATLGANGNIAARTITEEPMAIVMNLAMSQSFAYIDWASLVFPAIMKIDYVRIYQSGTASVTCDPPGWETTDYIANHPNAYTNKDVTSWEAAGYSKPLNKLMNGC